MPLIDLKVSNVRNLRAVEIKPASQINVICGANASGKTSLLESIYLLSRGKSFRTHHINNIINDKSTTLSISSRITQSGGQSTSLGIEHRDGQLRMKAEGTMLQRASDLASYLPLVVVHQDCHQMFTLGPRYRRRFLDWGVFHVEPSFLPAWRRYSRALRQRNASLQQQNSPSQRDLWDEELQESAGQVHALRGRYLTQFTKILGDYIDRLFQKDMPITIDYEPGWKTDEALSSILARSYIRDKALGYTQQGPHRADLRARINGRPAHEVMSRGQQKLLIYAMYLTQAGLYQKLLVRPCTLLADDIYAELDRARFTELMSLIEDIGAQTFITVVDSHQVSMGGSVDKKMFHVEHGKVKEVI